MQCATVTLNDNTVIAVVHKPTISLAGEESLTLVPNTQAMANQEAKYIPGTIHPSLLEVSSENCPTYESCRVKRFIPVHMYTHSLCKISNYMISYHTPTSMSGTMSYA